jgi:ssDNA-binding Zn-finger/Zn-ribbon topoisomerase 1
MQKRTGRFGPFYGCSKYPGCRGTREADYEQLADDDLTERSQKDQDEAWAKDPRNEVEL